MNIFYRWMMATPLCCQLCIRLVKIKVQWLDIIPTEIPGFLRPLPVGLGLCFGHFGQKIDPQKILEITSVYNSVPLHHLTTGAQMSCHARFEQTPQQWAPFLLWTAESWGQLHVITSDKPQSTKQFMALYKYTYIHIISTEINQALPYLSCIGTWWYT